MCAHLLYAFISFCYCFSFIILSLFDSFYFIILNKNVVTAEANVVLAVAVPAAAARNACDFSICIVY